MVNVVWVDGVEGSENGCVVVGVWAVLLECGSFFGPMKGEWGVRGER